MIEIFHFLKFSEFINELGKTKHIFHWGKWEEPIGNSAHTAECLTKRP